MVDGGWESAHQEEMELERLTKCYYLHKVERTTTFGVNLNSSIRVCYDFAYGKGYKIAIETLLGFEHHFLEVHDFGLDSDGVRLTTRGFETAYGRIRGKNMNMSIGLGVNSFGSKKVTGRFASYVGLVSLARFEGREAGDQSKRWSPS